jgi:hypothetical protein
VLYTWPGFASFQCWKSLAGIDEKMTRECPLSTSRESSLDPESKARISKVRVRRCEQMA